MSASKERLFERNAKRLSHAFMECEIARDWPLAADALYHLVMEYRARYAGDIGAGRKAFMADWSDLQDRPCLDYAWDAGHWWEGDPMEAVEKIAKWMAANL